MSRGNFRYLSHVNFQNSSSNYRQNLLLNEKICCTRCRSMILPLRCRQPRISSWQTNRFCGIFPLRLPLPSSVSHQHSWSHSIFQIECWAASHTQIGLRRQSPCRLASICPLKSCLLSEMSDSYLSSSLTRYDKTFVRCCLNLTTTHPFLRLFLPPSLSLFQSHLGTSVSLSVADIHQHQEGGDKYSHPTWDHVNWYEETNEGGQCQEGGRYVSVHEERGGTSFHDEGKPTPGEGFIGPREREFVCG